MSKRSMLLLLAAVLLAAVTTGSLALVNAAGERNDPPDQIDLDEIKEQAIRELYDQDGYLLNPDNQLAKVAMDHPGFGGFYFSDDRTTVYVFLLDPTDHSKARAAFEAAYQGRHSPQHIVPVQGQYAFDQLVEWYAVLNRASWETGIEVASSSVRELENRIKYTVTDEDNAEAVRELMVELDIPLGAVDLQIGSPKRLVDKDNVQAKWRPLVGGIQHEEAHGGEGLCTIGFVTERDNVEGLIIASHCTNSNGFVGGLNGADVHQPNDPAFGSNIVAVETIDPTATHIADPFSQCPWAHACRYSDAAFADLDDDEDLWLGQVAQPTAVGELDVSPAGTTYAIVAESQLFSVNDDVIIVGRTTGLMTGQIVDTCESFSDYAGFTSICAAVFQVTGGSPDPAGGDSGSPVMIGDPGDDDVELIGTFFGSIGDDHYFSKIGFIYMELGTSSTWDSCVSSC